VVHRGQLIAAGTLAGHEGAAPKNHPLSQTPALPLEGEGANDWHTPCCNFHDLQYPPMTTSTLAHSAASTPLRLLVVGGAGYIGSHMVKHLLRRGCDVVTFDNLSTGHRDAVLGGEFVLGDLADRDALDALFTQHQFDAVFHFASFIQVGESVKEPAKYYANNVVNTLNLLDAMVAHGVGRFVFSSTAAVYGEPAYTPIDEAHPKLPINPYGKTKWMVEQILEDYDRAYGLRSIALRYFNAAGADPEGQLGAGADAKLSILIYHRVLPVPDPLFPTETTVESFDAQLGLLKSLFNVLPLPEAVARLKAGTLPARAASITFDDGYADNFTRALPILQKHGLHATFFIATAYLDGGRMFNDTVIESIRQCTQRHLT
jgi:hypothetical protein